MLQYVKSDKYGILYVPNESYILYLLTESLFT